MDTCVDFESELFKPFLSEEAQVNPNVYGAELAWWFARELAKLGIETTYPKYEDWGWFIEYFVDDNEYWLCCGNVEDTKNKWRIYLVCKAKGMFGRNKAPVDMAKPLLKAVAKVLGDTEKVTNIGWSKNA
ncbi:MAG: hypothetical protein OIF38_02370 [Cellvibrionaceae bacterium]|nr:hypothetical protein [Cellvibrionaceae bacterium]